MDHIECTFKEITKLLRDLRELRAIKNEELRMKNEE
jgi:hypothetical protein